MRQFEDHTFVHIFALYVGLGFRSKSPFCVLKHDSVKICVHHMIWCEQVCRIDRVVLRDGEREGGVLKRVGFPIWTRPCKFVLSWAISKTSPIF